MRETATSYKNIGVEEELHKEMKIEAAIRGVSLRGLYDEAIRQFLTTNMTSSNGTNDNKAVNDAN